MNNKSKKMVKLLAVAACAAAISVAGAAMAGCGESGPIEGSATIDAQLTAANSNMLNGQMSTMQNGITVVSLKIDGDSYTLSKHYYSEHEGAQVPGEFDFMFTFTGSVTSADGDTYVIAPATGCDYTVDWAGQDELMAGWGQGVPIEGGTGDETTNPDCLNFFYTPYIYDSGENTKSMTVTISEGGLTFEGFNILPEV